MEAVMDNLLLQIHLSALQKCLNVKADLHFTEACWPFCKYVHLIHSVPTDSWNRRAVGGFMAWF